MLTQETKTSQLMPRWSVSLEVLNPAPHARIADVKQSPESSQGEMELTFCEESSTITLQYATLPASQQSFSMCTWACKKDQTVTQARENHLSHCCKPERNRKVYQPLLNGSWQLQLDTRHCSLVLLKSAKADSQHHQDWAQPFKRHIRPLTHRDFLFFPAVSCHCLSPLHKQTKKLSR